eukprot:1140892-Pelagomonas_calceolata.AAC.1
MYLLPIDVRRVSSALKKAEVEKQPYMASGMQATEDGKKESLSSPWPWPSLAVCIWDRIG